MDTVPTQYVSMGDLRDKWESENPGSVADTALPQAWTDKVWSQMGEFPFGFVWGYSPKSIFGVPVPLTNEAVEFYKRLPENLR